MAGQPVVGLAPAGGSPGSGRTVVGLAPSGGGGTSGRTVVGLPGGVAKKGGGGNFFGNLLGDVEHALTGIGPGIVKTGEAVAKDTAYYGTGGDWTHPKGGGAHTLDEVVKPIGKSYAQTYGPLVHGDVGGFLHGVEQHPLGPILDALTAATLGAGGVAKAGSVLAKVGAISDTSRLAHLGEASMLTAPDFAKRAGQVGEDVGFGAGNVPIKETAANPLIQLRQRLVNAGLNKLPAATPGLGSESRVVKALAKEPQTAAARVTVAGQPSTEAFGKLTLPERYAWHLTGQGVTPAEYKAFLAKQGDASPAMLKILDSPKVAELAANPSKNLQAALAEGRAASDNLTRMKVAAGHITEQSAAESPYRLLRLVNGAKVVEPTDAAIAKGLPTGYVDQPGREIPVLAKELAAQGKEQPFYIPHSAETGGRGGLFRNKPPAGFSAPAASGASRQNLGVLASQGRLAFNENPLAREYGKFAAFTEAQKLHDALVTHAAELPDGAALPHNYEFLKVNRGESSAPYTQRVGGQFEHGLDPGTSARMFTREVKDPEILRNAEGRRLVVPSSVKRIVESRQAAAAPSSTLHRLLLEHPTSVWKHMVLGLRPGFFGNITVGNSVLGALQAAPRHGFTSWLNQITPKLEGILGKRVSDATMRDVFPEHITGTFGRSTGFGGGAAGTSKLARGASRAYQGVMPPTIAYENVLRRAMVEGWAKASPEIQAAMKNAGGDVNQALRDVQKTHPQVIQNISKKTFDALGDYNHYNKLERGIKQIIPFYGWDRHIVRSAGRIVGEHPVRADALLNVGAQGHADQQRTLGELPSYMQSDVKLPGLPGFMGPLNGRTPLLDTHALNPFNTLADLAKLPQAVSGKAGGAGSETLSSGLNPIIQALIEQMTGRSLLSGAPIKGNAFANAAANIPQAALIQVLRGKGAPTKPTSLYQTDWQSKLAAFLGIPIKKTNLQTAHYRAATAARGH